MSRARLDIGMCVGPRGDFDHPEGRYRLEALVGQGGFSLVFRGRDQLLKRMVAIKHLRAEALVDAAARTLFAQEASVMARIQHPNVLVIHDHDEANDCLILEYADNGSLEDRLATLPVVEDYVRSDRKLDAAIARALPSIPDALELGIAILEGVAALHAQSVLHRDLKPSNIMFVQQVPKVSDLGLARPPDDLRLITSGANDGGTALYMAPEQWLPRPGETLTPAADVWAAGVILYRLFTGWWHLPFEPILANRDRGMARARVSDLVCETDVAPPTSRRPGLPAALDGVLQRALARDPRARYRSAGELVHALRSLRAPDRELFRHAQEAFHAGRHREARALIEPVMARDRPPLDAVRLFADICIQLREFDAALRAMERAGFASWPDPEAGSKLAHVLVLKNRGQEAIDAYRRGIARFTAELVLREKLAHLLWKQGRRSEARREIDDLLAIAPERASAIAMRNLLLTASEP
jgi:serine/threonine protein kinase